MSDWRSRFVQPHEDLTGMQREQLRDTSREQQLGEISLPASKSSAGFIDIYVVVDTRYRKAPLARRMGDSDGILFELTSSKVDKNQGQIAVPTSTEQVVEIEILSSFVLPKEYNSGAAYVDAYLQNEVTMEITNLNKQAFDDGNGNKHHFSLVPQTFSRNRIVLYPNYYTGDRANKITFSNPVTIRELNLRFRTPTELARIDDDYLLVAITYANPAVLTVVQSGSGAGSDGHHFANDVDCVAFQNFLATGMRAYDSENSSSVVYKEKFYQVTGISDTAFSIAVDLSGAIASEPTRPTTAIIYVGNRRSRIHFRMRAVRSYRTNYAVSVM